MTFTVRRCDGCGIVLPNERTTGEAVSLCHRRYGMLTCDVCPDCHSKVVACLPLIDKHVLGLTAPLFWG